MMVSEMSHHLGYKKSERSKSNNARNGYFQLRQFQCGSSQGQEIDLRSTNYSKTAINCDGRKEKSRTKRPSDSLRRWTDRLERHRYEFQRCIVHQVRNTLKYVATKDRKIFATDLKEIYTAQDELTAARIRDEVKLKWAKKYPHAMKSWRINWDVIVPIFKFSPTLRTIVYTTNAIESLNRQRSVFPNDTLFLATELATKKWTMPLQNWGLIYGKLSIIFEGRLPF